MGKAVKLQWDGVAQMTKCLTDAGLKIDDKTPEVKNVILPCAEAAMANAQNLAPIADRAFGKYQPGTLKKAIIATPGPPTQRGIFMVVRKRIAPYAPYVEFGTSKMPPRPFFRPAILQFASTYAASIAPGIKGILERAAAGEAYHPPK